MDKVTKKIARRKRIKRGIRNKFRGTPERPRLTVFRSNKEIYGQVIDDIQGRTLVAISSLNSELRDAKAKNKTGKSALVGEALANKALKSGVDKVVFDRNGYLYHGRVKAFADSARKGGLKF